MDHFTNSVPYVGTIAVGTTTFLNIKAPSDANGGGFTITEAYAVSPVAIAAGSSPQYELVTMNSSYAINGTIAAVTTGAWTAGTPKAFTISDGWVDGGEYVGVKQHGTAVNGDTLRVSVSFNAVMGK